MTARQVRRAQERRENKLSRRAENSASPLQTPAPPACNPAESPSISPAQLAANRANAQLSTGPNSCQGKAKSSLNAVKTGLTGRTVLLPGDDAIQYQQHVERFFARLNPAGDRESQLVQSLADTQWRLDRIPTLEMGIYALGRVESAGLFEGEDPSIRAALIDAHIFRTHLKEINSLYHQESRLFRQFQKHLVELMQLQGLRTAREKAEANATNRPPANPLVKSARSAENGFEFSNASSPAPVLPASGGSIRYR